ncbi:hypothetical protein ISG33_11825 [Glaciecola sp. MH2013]|uniref:DUF7674 family protein n=1 Tax=Glaciecola sp. MH2013 TaxID=2785524 RepID=UPI00189CED35|nr:hypothetical protein [Glaciecola sp. MH2013]MBF7074088.1 hypothetical protein [Glaciecola sp. MH2013]
MRIALEEGEGLIADVFEAMKIERSAFLRMLKEAFPELTSELNKQQGLLHFELSEFRKYTNKLIYAEEKELVKNCFYLAERAYLYGNLKLKTAIDVSYVEDLDFQSKDWAWQILPASLKTLYVSFHKRDGSSQDGKK